MKTTPFISQTEQPSSQISPAISNSDSLIASFRGVRWHHFVDIGRCLASEKLGFAPRNLGKPSLIKVKSSCSLGNKERVVVVEMNNEWLVLGVTAQSVNLLHQCPAKNETALTSVTEPLTFQSILKKNKMPPTMRLQISLIITNWKRSCFL